MQSKPPFIDVPGGPPVRMAPAGVNALYPAFDVTPSALVDAIVTERGVSRPPHVESLGLWTDRPSRAPGVAREAGRNAQ